ncbi:MAG: hypothetical protein AAF551_04005 [Bacteroidota bacterium]
MKTYHKTPKKRSFPRGSEHQEKVVIADHRPERILQRKLIQQMNAYSSNVHQNPGSAPGSEAKNVRGVFQFAREDREENERGNGERNGRRNPNVIDDNTYRVDPIEGEPFMETLVRVIMERTAAAEEINTKWVNKKTMERGRANLRIKLQNVGRVVRRKKLKSLKTAGLNELIRNAGLKENGEEYKDTFRDGAKASMKLKKQVEIPPVERQIRDLWTPGFVEIIRNSIGSTVKGVDDRTSEDFHEQLDEALEMATDNVTSYGNIFSEMINNQMAAGIIDENLSDDARWYIHWALGLAISEITGQPAFMNLEAFNNPTDDRDSDSGSSEGRNEPPEMDMSRFYKKFDKDHDNARGVLT